ncbi:MAG TPA: glycoside hydrolase family 3 C-terminal domain-containing protein [Anaeromyxobacteraceae bacterium]|nr:glycoside hydrolase family 3 C-terminal domain-containing protein [Anaeromyxobacteraceae bacterium]
MPWTDATLPPEQRAELLLSAMTLEEKLDLETGERCLNYGYFNAAIDRLGIPALTMTDGPAGVRIPYRHVNDGKATQLPAPIAVAASWEPELARAQGDVLGAEAFATGHNVVLGPTLDMPRTPLAGRLFEGFGEEPLLASQLSAAMVEGIQEHPVLADAKHFAAYTQETDRFTVDARLDERVLREIYLPPFEAAVRAGVASVMCGFNRVNGVYACDDRAMLTGVLKGEMGFGGFVLSDWGSVHGTVEAAMAGLDQELAFEKYFGRPLRDAVKRGEVPMAVVDDKARRIATAMFRFGLFDHPALVTPLPDREDGARSREIAERGVVLLKNDGDLLPLSAGVTSIAVIGADAVNANAQGAGAARVEPTYSVSPLDGIRHRAGAGVKVEHAPGGDFVSAADLLPGPTAIPSAVLTPPGRNDVHGLLAEYWMSPRFEGAPDLVEVEPRVARSLGFFNYPSTNASSVPQIPARFSLHRGSARWTGILVAPSTGDYTLTLTSRGRGWVYVDGRLVIDHSEVHDLGSKSVMVRMQQGEAHDLRVDYSADHPDVGKKTDLGGDVKLGWEIPAGAVLPAVQDAVALAARSDVAIVVARDYSTEERDHPSLALPAAQDDLIAAVAAANPRTIVVLTTGHPVAMPWLDQVRAVVEAWYPGQEQGAVIARVLFGDVNPSGKLPVSFPRRLADTAAGDLHDAIRDAQGPVVTFGESTLLGYRWYDAKGIEPLFPFGHGLSYTSFGYHDLEVTAGAAPGTTAGRAVSVAFTLANEGGRAGAEVAQVYVGRCPGDQVNAPRRLGGFAKVQLEPGASQRVVVDVAPEALTRWSSDTHRWTPVECDPPVFVGSSSRDLRLTSADAPASSPAPAPEPAAAGGERARGCGASGRSTAAMAVASLIFAGVAARRRRSGSRTAA